MTGGGMAERLKAAVLKTAGPSWARGFESHSLRHFRPAAVQLALAKGAAPFGGNSFFATAVWTMKTRWLLLAGSAGRTKNPTRPASEPVVKPAISSLSLKV